MRHALNIRDVDEDFLVQLKATAKTRGLSLKDFVLQALTISMNALMQPELGMLVPPKPREISPRLVADGPFAKVLRELDGLPESQPEEAQQVSLALPAEPVLVYAESLRRVGAGTAGLFVGSDKSFKTAWLATRWSVISAAKDPWHREMVGYKSFGAPKDHPEFHFARRGNHMALNLIDLREIGPNGETYVPKPVIDAALLFIEERLNARDNVLIHCNQGRSRAPFLALLYMQKHGILPEGEEGITEFRTIYPWFAPGAGISKYLEDANSVLATA